MRRFLPLAILLIGTQAAAQRDTTIRRDTVVLPTTIVTVTRAPLELSRVPFAVGLTTRDEIQRGKPGFALDEALAGIAGVQVDNRFNYALGERISIRGFGARAQFGVRGVRVLLDGIPMTLADGQTSLNNVDVATLARAEVFRGPASAMHGNASGGVIQLESDRGDEFANRRAGAELRASVGADGLSRYQISSRHTSPRQFATVTASQLKFGGYRDWNSATNDHVNFQIGQYFSAGALTLIGNWVAYDAKNPGALPDSLLKTPAVAWPGNKTTFRTREAGEQGQFGATWTQTIRGAELQVSAHGLNRRVDNPIPQNIVAIDRQAGGARAALSGQLVQRLRLSGGAEYQMQRDDRRNFVNTGGARGAVTLDQLERVQNGALFAQAAADIAPRLLLLVGARLDRIAFRASDRLITATNLDDSGQRTMSAASPSVGLSWRAASALYVYTNYATSFETPTTSELANQESGAGGFNQLLEPQRTRSMELGVNGQVGFGRFVTGTLQIAAYDARVRDALVPFEASPGGRQYFRNAGSTRHRGIEAATSLMLPSAFALRASFTHTDARFDRYVVTAGNPPVTSTFNGKRVPGVAANRADATLSYQPNRIFVHFETRAQSTIPVNNANTARSPSYVVHGMRGGLRELRVGALTLEPYVGVMNLFDRAYHTSVVVNAFGGRFYEPGPPRSLYGGLTAKF